MSKTLKSQFEDQVMQSTIANIAEQERQKGIQQLQAQYDAWNAQQAGIAELQAQYDAWKSAQNPQPVQSAPVQQPIQQATVNEVKEVIPSLADPTEQNLKYRTDRRNIALRKKKEIDEQEAKQTENNTLQQNIDVSSNISDDFVRQYAKQKGINEDQAAEEIKRVENMRNQNFTTPGVVDEVATAKAKEALEQSKIDKWLSSDYKLPRNEVIEARKYAQNELKNIELDSKHHPKHEEDKKHYADMVNLLNKTNVVTSALNNSFKAPLKAAQAIRGVFDKSEDAKWADESINNAIKASQTQHPVASNLGELLGNMASYALTEPVFGALGAAKGLGKVGTWALNQAGQNLQDIALHTAPMAKELYEDDGKLSKDDWKQILGMEGVAGDALGNLGMSAIPVLGKLGFDEAVKTVGNNADIFKNIDASGALKNAPDYLREAKDAAESIIPGMNNSVDEVATATKQAEEAKANLEGISKQLDDLAQTPNATEPLGDIAKGVEGPNYKVSAASTEMADKIDSDLKVIGKYMDDLERSGVLDGIDDPKVIKKWQDFQDAYSNYAFEAIKPGISYDDLNTARRGLEAKRQAFYRATKDSYPEIASTFSKRDFTNAIGRPLYTRYGTEKTPQQIRDGLEAIYLAEGKDPEWIKEQVGSLSDNDLMPSLESYEDALKARYDIKEKGITPEEFAARQKRLDDLAGQADDVGQNIDNAPQNIAKQTDEAKVIAEDTGIPKTTPEESIKGEWTIKEQPTLEDESEKLWRELSGETPVNGPGNIPTRTKEVNAQGQKLSKLHSNLQNTETLTAEQKKAYADKNGFWYDPDNERVLAENTKKAIEENGIDKMYDKYMSEDISGKRLNGQDTHNMFTASFDYNKMAQEALANGNKELADMYSAKARNIMLEARSAATEAGQFNAAIAYYARTPQGAVDKAYKKLGEQIKDFKVKNPKLSNEIDDLSKNLSDILKGKDVDAILSGTDNAAKESLRKEIMDGLAKYLDASKNKQLKNILSDLTTKEIDELIAGKYAKDIARTLDMFSMGSFGVKPETVDKVMDLFTEAEKYGFNSKEYYKLEHEAFNLLANDLSNGKSFAEKFDTWRYFAMLSNPLTHIRNNLGNLTNSVLTGTKNNLAAAIEAGADRYAKAHGADGIQGGRTKSILNLKTDGDLISGAAKDFDDNAYRQFKQAGNKWVNVEQELASAGNVWKDKGLGKVANKATDINSNLLDVEDVFAGKAKYQTSLAGFLKANGADASIFNATDDASKELLAQGREYALKQANEATFHQTNAFASWWNNMVRSAESSDSKVIRGVGRVAKTIMPFVKTPANILAACFEYSPAKFFEVAGKLDAWKKGAVGTAEMIDDIAKGSTGSAGLGIGALLASAGIISVSGGDDTEDTFNSKRGIQTLALKVGDKYVNIGDLAPASMPLIIGASVYETVKNTWGKDPEAALNAVVNGIGTIGDTVTDMTLLSGIADALSTIKYADDSTDIGIALGLNTLENMASQVIPTVGGKIEKTIDDTKRTSYTNKTGTLGKSFDQTRKYLQTKIPGLQELGETMEKSDNQKIASIGDYLTNEPQIDGWGNEMKVQDYGIGVPGRVINNFVNPMTTTTDISNRVDEELKKIYEDSKQDETVLRYGYTYSGEAKVDGAKMTDKQWTEYQKGNGQMKLDLAKRFIDSSKYSSLSAKSKVDVLNDMQAFAKAYNQNKVVGAEMSSTNQKLAEIYKTGGAQAVVNELVGNAQYSASVESAGGEKSAAAKKAYEEGGDAAVQEYVTAQNALEAAGLKNNETTREIYNTYGDQGLTDFATFADYKYGTDAFERYQYAKKSVPSLTSEQYNETLSKIDGLGVDGKANGQITQSELIEYLNKTKASQSEADKLWKTYGKFYAGEDNWAKIPVLEGNTWKAKKKKK